MVNEKPNTLLKSIVLAASWLMLSPLFLILDGRWKLLPKWLRIMLFIASPLMLYVIVMVPISCYFQYWGYWYPRHHFVKPKVIENITGVRLPKYKVVEYNMNRENVILMGITQTVLHWSLRKCQIRISMMNLINALGNQTMRKLVIRQSIDGAKFGVME